MRWKIKRENVARYGIAAVAGLLLALAFPHFSAAGLAWIAPGMLLFSAAGATARTAFRCGYIGGFLFYLATLYWLLHIPLPFLPILGWIALSAYVALYPALWVALCWRLGPAERSENPWDGPLLDRLLNTSWSKKVLWTLNCAAIWVALEMVLGRFLSGFPWEYLGVSQYKMLPIIQISEFIGVYGVSFLLVWFSVSVTFTALAIVRRKSGWARDMALPLGVVLALEIFGIRTMREYSSKSDGAARIALIQPSIPQTLIWDQRENENRFRQLMKLSKEALTNEVDIMIWPEASVPNMLRHHPETSRAIIDLVREHDVWAILGSDDADYREGTLEIDYFNSAFAVSPEGVLKGRYIKRQLVIFGEYMPFAERLPFLRKISPAGEAGFTAGKKPAPFDLEDLGVNTSVLICFEDIFPHLVREYVTPETDFLINLTNNGWFGESAAQWQHAAAAAFRAVENRIPLVRCANNGLTCWVDEAGRMHDVRFPGSDDIYKAGYKISTVPVLPSGQQRALTFYTRHGDFFGWTCAALAMSSLVLQVARERNQRKRANLGV